MRCITRGFVLFYLVFMLSTGRGVTVMLKIAGQPVLTGMITFGQLA